jgi:radical SAM protein with 4Fe4S-binding SPASM domain|tara:strand:- start:1029 stop:2120 length:1092 start_codon:yes stop_codon:yes gene_type:complete
MVSKNNFFNSVKYSSYFITINNLRRAIFESAVFDFLIIPHAAILEKFPGALVIDNTNLCNAKCSWCPNDKIPEPRGIMDDKLFQKIIEDYAKIGGIVRFGTFGEPLLDPEFMKKIDFVRKFPSIYKLEVITNGYALTEEMASKLIDYRVDTEISLDELDKSLYEDIKGVSFEKTWNNLVRLIGMNDKAKKPVQINIRIKTSSSEESIKNNPLFKELFHTNCTVELNPISSRDSLSSWGGIFDKNSFLSEEYNSPPHRAYKNFNLKNQAPCHQLWKWMVINWDGKVVLCCTDIFASVVLGDLKKENIEEVWCGPFMTERRRRFKNRDGRKNGICKNCDLHLGWQFLKLYYNSKSCIREERRFIS